jgi:hypothetical protein
MNIIELAKQAGMEQDGEMWFSNLYKTDMDVHTSHLEAFAKLVAAHEREECAVIAETPIRGEQDDITMEAKDRVAKTIRARSNTCQALPQND